MAFFRIYVILLVPFSLILVYREFYFSHTSRRTRFSSMEIIRTAADGSRSPSCCFFSAALRIIRYSFVALPINENAASLEAAFSLSVVFQNQHEENGEDTHYQVQGQLKN